MFKKSQTLFELCIIGFLSLTPLLWLKNKELIIGHDAGIRLNGIDYLYDLFFSWTPQFGFGKDWSLYKAFLITKLPEIGLVELVGNFGLGQSLAAVLWFFIMGASMYIFTKAILPEKNYWIARILSSVFYMYNFYILQAWFIFERAKFALYAALPLTLLISYKTLTKDYSLLKGTLLFGLVLFFFNGGGSPPLFGALLLSQAILLGYFTLLHFKKEGKQAILHTVKMIVSFSAFTSLLNAYWILPQINLIFSKYGSSLGEVGGVQGVLAWENMLSQYSTFTNIFRLQGIPGWYDNPLHAYANTYIHNPLLIAASFIPFGVILFGLSFKYIRKYFQNPLLHVLLLMLILGLIFTSGSRSPFGFIYTFFVQHVPGFAIFRSSFFKFGPAVWFSLIILFSYIVNLLLLKFVPNRRLYTAIGVILIALVPLYHAPYFSNTFFNWSPPFSTKVTIPNYVTNTVTYLNKYTDNSRVLLLPPLEPYVQGDSMGWGYWGLTPLLRNSWSGSVIVNEDKAPAIIDSIYQSIRTGNEQTFTRLTRLTGTDITIWRDDVLYQTGVRSKNLTIYKEHVEAFAPANTSSFGKWHVYHFTDVKPRIFSTNNVISSDQSQYIGDIFEASNLPDDAVIVFSENGNTIDEKLIKQKIITAECIYCNSKYEEDFKKSLSLPPVKILPSSMLYSFVTKKEQKIQDASTLTPSARIDAETSYAGKRLSEVSALLEEKNNQKYTKETLKRYNQHISTIDSLLPSLSGKELNDYSLRLLAYMELHRETIHSWDKSTITPSARENSLKQIDQIEEKLNKNIWKTTSVSHAKFIATIASPGEHRISVPKRNGEIKQITVDGKAVEQGKQITLSAGDHFIEITYNSPRKMVENKIDEPIIAFTKDVAHENKSAPHVSFDRHDPTYYSVHLRQTDTPYILVFGDSFADWKLYPKFSDNHWITRLMIPFMKPLPEYKHIKVNGYANGWIIDPKDSEEYILFYRPQWFTYAGVAISLLTILATLWTIIKLWKK